MKTNQDLMVLSYRSYEAPHSRQVVLESESVLCGSLFTDLEGIEETTSGNPMDY